MNVPTHYLPSLWQWYALCSKHHQSSTYLCRSAEKRSTLRSPLTRAMTRKQRKTQNILMKNSLKNWVHLTTKDFLQVQTNLPFDSRRCPPPLLQFMLLLASPLYMFHPCPNIEMCPYLYTHPAAYVPLHILQCPTEFKHRSSSSLSWLLAPNLQCVANPKQRSCKEH